jgi:predicted DNA-binding helix-hairpin-helix protein
MSVIKSRIEQSKAERRESVKAPLFAPAGQSTQMIIGATPATDTEVLAQASSLYGEQRLRRVYYSAFSPIPDASSKLPLVAPPLVREHRLYQADWLMRFYGFEVGELTTAAAPNLDLTIDPKLAWGLRNPEKFPVDVNKAARELLLRVPGLGVRNVDRILRIRRWHSITVADLTRLRVPLKKTLPFIIAADHRPHLLTLESACSQRNSAQLELFTAT